MAIRLLGHGELVASLAREVEAEYLPDGAGPSPAWLLSSRLLVWCRDGCDWPADLAVQRRLREQPVPFLPIWRLEDELWVGPLQQQAGRGCIACLRHRMRQASPDRDLFDACSRVGLKDSGVPVPPFVAAAVSGFLREEAERLAGGVAPRTLEALFSCSLRTGRFERHPMVPHAACEGCGLLPRDTAENVIRPDQSRSKPDCKSFRAAAIPPDTERIRRRFVDFRTGIILNELRRNDWLPVSEAKLLVAAPKRMVVPNFGREFDYVAADRVALLEALERYAGLHAQAKVPTVKGSYRELADRALDPAALILHSPSACVQADSELTMYTPDLPIQWVWAYSFKQDRPCLVPEQAVYYGSDVAGPCFLSETSNGCALGASWEEAIFHGLLEVLERDALLLTWYAQLPVPRLSLQALGSDIRLLDVIDRAERRGYQVDAFNITTEIGLPSVAAIAWRPDGTGPFACLGAGAHPDPVMACKGAIAEAVFSVPECERIWQEQQEQIRNLAGGGQVRTIHDHQYLNLLPEARQRFDFLLQPGRVQAFSEAFGRQPWVWTNDLQHDLQQLVGKVLAAGLDVLAVDQTPPELRSCGLHAARVLVPGTLPLSFGDHMRRVDGATRIMTVPPRLGYPAPQQVNPSPHPMS